MPTQLKTLQLLQIPVWVERASIPLQDKIKPVSPATLIFVAETEAEFTSAHQQQLQRILDYLQLSSTALMYADTASETVTKAITRAAANTAINFGQPAAKLLPHLDLIHTHSISAMLTNPACKREVLHDLNRFKHKNAEFSGSH